MPFQSINPATEALERTYDTYRPERVDQALTLARSAFVQWRETSFAERSQALQRVASVLRAQKADLARMASHEMGKPIREAEAEIEKCA